MTSTEVTHGVACRVLRSHSTLVALRARIQLPPPSPLYAGHAGYARRFEQQDRAAMRDSSAPWVNNTKSDLLATRPGVGVWGPLPKTLTLFMTKICDFPYPIYDMTKTIEKLVLEYKKGRGARRLA